MTPGGRWHVSTFVHPAGRPATCAVRCARGGGGRADGAIAGFASLSAYKERAAYRSTVEDSVYVGEAFRGRGVAKTLLAEILSVAEARGFHSVIARVVGGHEASIRLHRAAGFELVGVEREVGRKFGRWLDVVIMQRML